MLRQPSRLVVHVRTVVRRRSDVSSSFSSVSESQFSQDLAKLGEQAGGFDALASRLSASQRAELSVLLEEARNAPPPAQTTVPEPSRSDLRQLAFTTGIPFIGFGIMDNAILIIAGDAIDTSLGVLLGISTMCAAAIGNIVSDVAGILFGTAIEDFCAKYLKLPTPMLTTAQRQLRSVRWANQFGLGVGLTLGCIIGMFPLLFIDSNKIQTRKREAHLDSLFRDAVTEVTSLVGAQRTSLYLRVDADPEKQSLTPQLAADGKYLYAKYDGFGETTRATSKPAGRLIPLGRGIISRAALTGESWNIADVQAEPDYAKEEDAPHHTDEEADSSSELQTMLCVPILDSQGRAIAVIQAINKRSEREDSTAQEVVPGDSKGMQQFSASDVQMLKAVASHISVALQRMYEADEEEQEMRLKDTIRILKDYGLAGISPAAEQAKMYTRPLFPEN